jgi:hypothetical protein
MRSSFVLAMLLPIVECAYADKYGIDEALAEGGASWGAVVLVVLVLLYLHFKEK